MHVLLAHHVPLPARFMPQRNVSVQCRVDRVCGARWRLNDGEALTFLPSTLDFLAVRCEIDTSIVSCSFEFEIAASWTPQAGFLLLRGGNEASCLGGQRFLATSFRPRLISWLRPSRRFSSRVAAKSPAAGSLCAASLHWLHSIVRRPVL